VLARTIFQYPTPIVKPINKKAIPIRDGMLVRSGEYYWVCVKVIPVGNALVGTDGVMVAVSVPEVLTLVAV